MVPVQIAPRNLGDFIATATAIGNLDGLVVTVPHKFECFRHCASATERASLLGSVNVMRRASSGWFGDIVDGLGFVGAARRHGRDRRGERALLIGAGGAGSAIALALLDAGVRELAISRCRRGAARRFDRAPGLLAAACAPPPPTLPASPSSRMRRPRA